MTSGHFDCGGEGSNGRAGGQGGVRVHHAAAARAEHAAERAPNSPHRTGSSGIASDPENQTRSSVIPPAALVQRSGRGPRPAAVKVGGGNSKQGRRPRRAGDWPYPLTNFRYVTRCGGSASGPFRFFKSSIYEPKFSSVQLASRCCCGWANWKAMQRMGLHAKPGRLSCQTNRAVTTPGCIAPAPTGYVVPTSPRARTANARK